MSLSLKTIAVALLAAAALFPSWPSWARIVSAPGCRIAQKLDDGTWLIRTPTSFGRAGRVDAGAVIYKRTVINGVDLAAALDARCRLSYEVQPDYDSFTWPPNGYWSWVTPLQ